MKMLVINYGSMNTAALQRINGNTYPNYDDALSDTWFTVVDAFTYTALCYVLELVHEAICDGKEM